MREWRMRVRDGGVERVRDEGVEWRMRARDGGVERVRDEGVENESEEWGSGE